MKAEFVRNESVPFCPSSSYNMNVSLCNHHVQKMNEAGRTLIVTLDSVKDILPSTHFSPTTLAPKPGEPAGSMCNNLSMGGDLSLNKNVDLEAWDEVYPWVIYQMFSV